MKEFTYPIKEYKELLKLKKEWCKISFGYESIVNLIEDIELFRIIYPVTFPKTKNIIKRNQTFNSKIAAVLIDLKNYSNFKNLDRNKFNLTIHEIDLAFHCILYEIRYGEIYKGDDIF